MPVVAMSKARKTTTQPQEETTMPTTTSPAPSQLDLAYAALETAIQRRDATKAEGLAAQRALQELSPLGDEVTSKEWVQWQVTQYNLQGKVARLREQLVSDTQAVEQADRRLLALHKRSRQLEELIVNHLCNLRHSNARKIQKAQRALGLAQDRLAQAEEVKTTKEREFATWIDELAELTGD